jgi:hypothetical protein
MSMYFLVTRCIDSDTTRELAGAPILGMKIARTAVVRSAPTRGSPHGQ